MSRAGTWCVRKAIWRFTIGATLTAGLTFVPLGLAVSGAQGLAGVSTKTTVAAFPVSFPSQSSSRFAVSSAATSVSMTGSSFAAVAIQAWIGRTAKLFGLNINWQVQSSVIGLNDFAARQVDVGASEIPYNSDQAQITPAFPYQYVPDVAGGLSFMYNLPGKDGQRISESDNHQPIDCIPRVVRPTSESPQRRSCLDPWG